MRYNMVNNSQSRCVGISFYTKGAFFMRKKQFKAESKRLLDLIAARCVPQRNFGWFGSFCWASAAVRCLGEFAQKMKWEAICEPVEMKQGFSPAWHEACHALAARIAGCMHR